MNIQYNWNKETGMCIASIILPNGDVLQGYATCHPDDEDMCNEKTGEIIAGYRLYIKTQQYNKNYNLRPQLKALRHLQSLYKRDPNYNEQSYENRTLRRQIKLLEAEIHYTKVFIDQARKDLKEYINLKDSFYKKIRAKRGQDKLNQESENS